MKTTFVKSRVFYQVFIRSFADSNGDGIGDLNGLISKLDYLKNLGITGIWLSPLHPSPSYHKYDVVDYYNIDKEYGTLSDFKRLISEAQLRNIRVLLDLVINHTSEFHPWFLEAQTSKDSPYRNYYVWRDSKKLKDKSNWHFPKHVPSKPIETEMYYGLFWSGMPDLNFDSKELRIKLLAIAKYWLIDMGVDGFRLDAAQHIYGEKKVKKNVAWWQYFRQELNKIKPTTYLVGEVMNTSKVVVNYLNDSLNACFNFDLAQKILEGINSEKGNQLVPYLLKIRAKYAQQNENFEDAIFLSNHDQNRTFSVLENRPERAKLAASVLLTLPGTPFIYYGEELGMKGLKPDEHLREPFLWSKGLNDKAQTTWISNLYNNEHELEPLFEQQKNGNSLYSVYKRLISLRNNTPCLNLGTIRKGPFSHQAICSFYRETEQDSLLVIHNFKAKQVTVKLSENDQKYKRIFYESDRTIFNDLSKISISGFGTVILSLEK